MPKNYMLRICVDMECFHCHSVDFPINSLIAGGINDHFKDNGSAVLFCVSEGANMVSQQP